MSHMMRQLHVGMQHAEPVKRARWTYMFPHEWPEHCGTAIRRYVAAGRDCFQHSEIEGGGGRGKGEQIQNRNTILLRPGTIPVNCTADVFCTRGRVGHCDHAVIWPVCSRVGIDNKTHEYCITQLGSTGLLVLTYFIYLRVDTGSPACH